MKRDFEKPKTMEEQVSFLWDFMTNDIWHKVGWNSIKITFILSMTAIILAFMAVIVGFGAAVIFNWI